MIMNVAILILGTCFLIIAAIELLKLDKASIGALMLTAIAFIYVGFAGNDLKSLSIEGGQALIFLLIAYYGLTKKTWLIPFGLALHALWDVIHLWTGLGELTPLNYEIYCIGVDSILAIYLFLKLK